MAIVDAADPEANIYLPPEESQGVLERLLDGAFLLLTAHRQAGKTTLAHAIISDLQRGGCFVAVVYLTILHEGSSCEVIFKCILDQLGVLPEVGVSASHQLQQFIQRTESPQLILVFEESDAIQRLPVSEQLAFMQKLRVLKQTCGPR